LHYVAAVNAVQKDGLMNVATFHDYAFDGCVCTMLCANDWLNAVGERKSLILFEQISYTIMLNGKTHKIQPLQKLYVKNYNN